VRVLALLSLGGVAVVAAGGVVARATSGAKPVQPREVHLTLVGRFAFPVYLTAPVGDMRRLFVVEKAGRIKVVRDGRVLTAPFLDLSREVADGNEPGLFSLAFSPDYSRNRRLYVYFVGKDGRTHLLEFQRLRGNGDRADLTTRREVLSFEHGSGEHFGGLLLFGPDRKLYLSTGDGGLNEWQDKMRAQRLDDVNGKLLRVIPTTGAVRVVARGFRNPWRFTIDETTGDLYVGDAGEFVRESIKYARASEVQGANFGWPCFEGSLPSKKFAASLCPRARPPLHEYAREGGNCSVIGGVVVHDPRLSTLRGRYLYADYCLGEVIVLSVKDRHLAAKRSLRVYEPGVTSFGTDARRRVYLVTAAGPVYRIDPRKPKSAEDANAPLTGGKELFLASGCGTCHSFTPAKTTGTYGPNLDKTRPTRALVIERVTRGKGLMPSFNARLTGAQIRAIAEFVAKP
jgi:mono/diheme cytochrome c family protein